MLLSLYLVRRAVALIVSRCSLAIKRLFFYFGVLYPTRGTPSMPLFVSRMVYNAPVSVRIGKRRRLNENTRLKSSFNSIKVGAGNDI